MPRYFKLFELLLLLLLRYENYQSEPKKIEEFFISIELSESLTIIVFNLCFGFVVSSRMCRTTGTNILLNVGISGSADSGSPGDTGYGY